MCTWCDGLSVAEHVLFIFITTYLYLMNIQMAFGRKNDRPNELGLFHSQS